MARVDSFDRKERGYDSAFHRLPVRVCLFHIMMDIQAREAGAVIVPRQITVRTLTTWRHRGSAVERLVCTLARRQSGGAEKESSR